MGQFRFDRRAGYCGACSLAIMVNVLAATGAAAQDDNPVALDEIVVTARKVAENLQDVPVAVTAFSGEELIRQNAVKVEVNSPATPFNAEFVDVTTRPAWGEANVRGSLSFRDSRYQVAAFGRNIFNNRDRVSGLSLIGFGFVAGQYREPATYGIQATYRFGQ